MEGIFFSGLKPNHKLNFISTNLRELETFICFMLLVDQIVVNAGSLPKILHELILY